MMDYRNYQNPSFKKPVDREEMKKRTVLYFAATGVLFLFLFFFGVRMLTALAFLIDGTKPPEVVNQKKEVVSTPRLESPFEATNSAVISIKGYSSEGTTVELYLNGTSSGSQLVGKDGGFTFSKITLSEGNNKITAIATSLQGFLSDRSEEISIVFDKNQPKIEIVSPSNDSVINGTDNSIKVVGKTENIETLTVNGYLVIITPTGGFSYTIKLNNGENIIKTEGVSRSGNKTTVEIKITYEPLD